MPVPGRELNLKNAIRMLLLAISVAVRQVQRGCFYIFEHPHNATSWQCPAMLELPGDTADFDQCMVGLVGPKPADGEALLIKKRTKIKTNLPGLIEALGGQNCDGSHDHMQITGQQAGCVMSKWSQVYPAPLCGIFSDCVCRVAR